MPTLTFIDLARVSKCHFARKVIRNVALRSSHKFRPPAMKPHRDHLKSLNEWVCKILSSMFRGMIAFLVGIYTGIYVSQNYNVPKVDDPAALYEKVKEFADNYKK